MTSFRGAAVFDALMRILLSGGKYVENLAHLRQDKGLERLLGQKLMAPSTAHDFLRRICYGGMEGLGQTHQHMLARMANQTGTSRLPKAWNRGSAEGAIPDPKPGAWNGLALSDGHGQSEFLIAARSPRYDLVELVGWLGAIHPSFAKHPRSIKIHSLSRILLEKRLQIADLLLRSSQIILHFLFRQRRARVARLHL